MYYGEGISREASMLDAGVEAGILEKSGAWYLWGEERLGQGRDNSRAYLKEHPAIADKIEALIRQKYFSPQPAAAATPLAEKPGAKVELKRPEAVSSKR